MSSIQLLHNEGTVHAAYQAHAAERRIGQILTTDGTISEAQLADAVRSQGLAGGRLGDILLTAGTLTVANLYAALAAQFAVRLVRLAEEGPDAELLRFDMLHVYRRLECIPWRVVGDVLVVATSDPAGLRNALPHLALPEKVAFVVVERSDLLACLQATFADELSHASVRGLAERRPTLSAHRVVTGTQAVVLSMLATGVVIAGILAPIATLIALNGLLSVWFFATTIFKIWLVERGTTAPEPVDAGEARVADEDLPIYTILVPMYKEPEVLPLVSRSLMSLDYPRDKLDIKLVLEDDDVETLAVARSLNLPSCFEIVAVPASHPRTKPKACNYALHFAKGDFLVIYDAEDIPEADQLRKVLRTFRELPADYACIQARLNYYNAEENWLTRMFTLEYTMLFDVLLPGLYRLGIPIPLGGTSNHFKIAALRDVGAWDPFNVTEDADLGVRLSQVNYRVAVVNSTTLEEANCAVGNWVRQRSRWIKGYMQTWLVHMRHPLQLLRSVGPRGFVGFQLFVGGTIVNSFAAIAFWLVFAGWAAGFGSIIGQAFPTPLLVLGAINLLFCNAALVYLTMLPLVRRGYWSLIPWAVTVPAYWLLMSVAGCKALWQLVTNPFHWEKTKHGISRFHGAPAIAGAATPALAAPDEGAIAGMGNQPLLAN